SQRYSQSRLAAATARAVFERQHSAVAFGYLAAEREPDARTAGFGSEERDEEVRGVGQSWAFVFDRDFEERVVHPPGHERAAAGLQRRVDSVADDVDQQLFQLIPVAFDRQFGSGDQFDLQSGFEAGDAANPGAGVHRLQVGLRQLRELRISGHEAVQSLGARGDDRQAALQILFPIGGALGSRHQALQAPGYRFDRSERIVQLVAEDAHQPLPGQPLLLTQRAA